MEVEEKKKKKNLSMTAEEESFDSGRASYCQRST